MVINSNNYGNNYSNNIVHNTRDNAKQLQRYLVVVCL